MGQFSWLDCVDGSQILDNVPADVYVLVPKEFRDKYGTLIHEEYYDGYGHFGGYDIFDLIADWNRKALSENPDFVLPYRKIKVSELSYYEKYADLNTSRDEIASAVNSFFPDYRCVGIDLACYDEDNAALPYSIKITHSTRYLYEECKPSESDPNQGWPMEEDEKEYI